MSRELKPLFSLVQTTFSFSENTAPNTADINGVLIKNNDPPSAQQVGSIAINNDGTGTGGVTITVKCQLYFGVDVGYGSIHNVKDENGTDITFEADSDETVEANLYQQDWWKENEGFRIILERTDGATALAGNAVCILK